VITLTKQQHISKKSQPRRVPATLGQIVLTGKLSVGQYLTATATDPGGDTSEFSNDQGIS
jgi:hypothetical protein